MVEFYDITPKHPFFSVHFPRKYCKYYHHKMWGDGALKNSTHLSRYRGL